jgi:hypothetical protein
VDELAVVVDLPGEVRVVLVGRLEDDLGRLAAISPSTTRASGAPWSHW